MRLGKDGVIISDDDDVDLDRTWPELDECRTVLLHVVRQAIDDFQSFKNKTREDQAEAWVTASGFIFDDEYYIEWGGIQLNLEQICDFIDLNIDWVRTRINLNTGIKLKIDGTVGILEE